MMLYRDLESLNRIGKKASELDRNTRTFGRFLNGNPKSSSDEGRLRSAYTDMLKNTFKRTPTVPTDPGPIPRHLEYNIALDKFYEILKQSGTLSYRGLSIEYVYKDLRLHFFPFDGFYSKFICCARDIDITKENIEDFLVPEREGTLEDIIINHIRDYEEDV